LAAAGRDVWQALLKQRSAHLAKGDEKQRAGAMNKAAEDLKKSGEALAKARENVGKSDGEYTPLGPSYPRTSTGRRLALAKWIVDPRNPLTPRVAVNYVWMHHFGRPLVDSVFDFGLRTPEPPLADVLDWLAADLVESGWDLKRLHRQIVLSEAYQRASTAETSQIAFNAAIDRDNQLCWRAESRRLEAEVVRDSLLATGGRLDPALGGPDIDHAQGESVYRRSLYFRHAHEKQMTMLSTFDAANPNDCYRRSSNIVPQQALALSNSQLSVSMARAFVARHSSPLPPASDAEFVTIAFRSLLAREPDARERETCIEFLVAQRELLTRAESLTRIESPLKATVAAAESPEVRARENLVHTLMNHNDFVTVR
jgi:hypothetical protein